MATRIASRVAARIFSSPSLVEDGRVYRQQAGSYNDYGEFEPGGYTRQDVKLVSWPFTGQDRMTLPEALREEEGRKFCVQPVVDSISDTTQGDVLFHNNRPYRAQVVNDWGGFREVLAILPTDADITSIVTAGDFDARDFDPNDFLTGS